MERLLTPDMEHVVTRFASDPLISSADVKKIVQSIWEHDRPAIGQVRPITTQSERDAADIEFDYRTQSFERQFEQFVAGVAAVSPRPAILKTDVLGHAVWVDANGRLLRFDSEHRFNNGTEFFALS